MCNILKFTQSQNSLVVLIPYLLTYSQQCFVTTLLRNLCLCVMFSVLMVLIKRWSPFVILPIINHVQQLKLLKLNICSYLVHPFWKYFKTCHIIADTIHQGLLWTSPLSGSTNLINIHCLTESSLIYPNHHDNWFQSQ